MKNDGARTHVVLGLYIQRVSRQSRLLAWVRLGINSQFRDEHEYRLALCL